jgi:hypothetical protein
MHYSGRFVPLENLDDPFFVENVAYLERPIMDKRPESAGKIVVSNGIETRRPKRATGMAANIPCPTCHKYVHTRTPRRYEDCLPP